MNTYILPVLRAIVREVLTPPAIIIAALLFLWEEVLWVWLGRGMAIVGRAPPIAAVEAKIKTLQPYSALAFFAVPLAITYLPKLLALWLIASGHFWSGIILLGCLEVVAAAVLARIYTLCRPALNTLQWFAQIESLLLRWSKWAHDRFGIKQLREAVQDAAANGRNPGNPFDQGGGLT